MDIKAFKENITNEDIAILLDRMNVPYYFIGDSIRAKTFCHNDDNELANAGFNLSINSPYATCYSHCESMDIIELFRKARRIRGLDSNLLPTLKFMGMDVDCQEKNDNTIYHWGATLKKYKKGAKNTINYYDDSILSSFDKLIYEPWVDEGISIESLDKFNIRYYPRLDQIVIPVFDSIGLVGIRVRNLLPELEEYAKYDILRLLDDTKYIFDTSSTLYNINNINSSSIIIAEGEKSVMKLDSWGYCGVALFGHNINSNHVKLLLQQGVNQVTIALDNDMDDKAYNKIYEKCKNFMQVYRVRDIDNRLGEKDSPMDLGCEYWDRCYVERERMGY